MKNYNYFLSCIVIRVKVILADVYLLHPLPTACLQKNASIPLDFTYFACSTISVSFTVVSKYSIMADERVQFSPSTTVCVPGGEPVLATSDNIVYKVVCAMEYIFVIAPCIQLYYASL